MTYEKTHNWINTILIVAVGILVLVGGQSASNDGFGGSRYPNGISADSTSPSAGEVRGTTLTTTGAVTLGGAATLSSTMSVAATSTLSGPVLISNTASSTVQIGSTADGVGPGCLVLGDSASATATPVYITATGATITGTTTKPAICR